MASDKTLSEKLKADIFLDGPGDLLCKLIAQEIAKVPEWLAVFENSIDTYERFDFTLRQLPALRIYSHLLRKEQESHYCVGDVLIDIVLPPSLRREDLQTVQDRLGSAMLQQFRRPTFFQALRAVVPGLNELGKVFVIDKTLGMKWQEETCPITQLQVNFRLDLKEWDHYLEEEGRTKDEPFKRTLGELKRIVTTIDGLRTGADLATKDVSVDIDQTQGD